MAHRGGGPGGGWGVDSGLGVYCGNNLVTRHPGLREAGSLQWRGSPSRSPLGAAGGRGRCSVRPDTPGGQPEGLSPWGKGGAGRARLDPGRTAPVHPAGVPPEVTILSPQGALSLSVCRDEDRVRQRSHAMLTPRSSTAGTGTELSLFLEPLGPGARPPQVPPVRCFSTV